MRKKEKKTFLTFVSSTRAQGLLNSCTSYFLQTHSPVTTFCLSPKSNLSSFLQNLTPCQVFHLAMIIFGRTRWSFPISILFLFPLLSATLTPHTHGCVLSDSCFKLVCACPSIWSHRLTVSEVNGKSSWTDKSDGHEEFKCSALCHACMAIF